MGKHVGTTQNLYRLCIFYIRDFLTGLLRQWRTRSTQQREGNMNTISITNPETNDTITYTEAEVLRFIQTNTALRKFERDTIYKVRDFFSEGEWEDNATTFTRDEVNTLLRSIGAEPIRAMWTATINITATVTGYEAEDENDAINCIENDVELNIGSGDISLDTIEVSDVEVDE
jgi:hypothetical protein